MDITMNKKQKVVFAIGLFLFFLAGFFPNFEGRYNYENISLSVRLGRHCILNPFSGQYVKDIVNESFGEQLGKYDLFQHEPSLRFRSVLLFEETIIQLVIIVASTIGTVLLLATKKEKCP